MFKALALALLCTFACQADTAVNTVITWTIGDTFYSESTNDPLSITGAEGWGTTLCSTVEELGCVVGLNLVSAPNVIPDRFPTVG